MFVYSTYKYIYSNTIRITSNLITNKFVQAVAFFGCKNKFNVQFKFKIQGKNKNNIRMYS